MPLASSVCQGHMNMWTKFRPGVREFLKRSQENFDLHVFTMGDKNYAAEMARLLDPTGALFNGRVASSSDAADGTMMKDLDVLLGSEDMMVILDDTLGVWWVLISWRFDVRSFAHNLNHSPALGSLARV